MQVNSGAPGQNKATSLYAGAFKYLGNPIYPGGMQWSLLVTTPQSPVAFGTGSLELVQLVTPQRSYMTLASPPVSRTDPENGQFGLDTFYPYSGSSVAESKTPEMPYDAPSMSLNNAASAKLADSFTDYLMYAPPNSGQYVPIATLIWTTSGSATIPPTTNPVVISDWSSYASYYGSDAAGGVAGGGQFNATNTFPSWTVIDKFPGF